MIFHSLDFVVFFLITTLIYWRLPRRGQNLFIVAASYVFYGYVHHWFAILLGVTTVTDYTVARAMERYPSRRRALLAITLTTNLGLLGVFKYFNFFVENVHAAFAALGWQLSMPVLAVILPVGLSFYTFQSLSYTIDVYRRQLRARRSFVDFAVFVSFYPQLVAGPIERASHLLPQIEKARVWSWPAARDAAFLMAWGFFKKIVIADNVGVIANKVFSLADPGFTVLWAGVLAFSIQIYADFSAYSDIARGAARWLGFDLIVNFNHPYMASGPVDFWRRWHISLSTWFRDYVYIPLGGSRRGPARALVNLWITFLVSGLWHGASWNYVIWGAYHGTLVAVSRVVGSRVPSAAPAHEAWAMLEPLRVLGMFLLTCVGWLIFRETDLQMLWRGLSLSPWHTTLADRQVGASLILMTLLYSVPLWIHGIWAVYVVPTLRPRVAPDSAWGGWATTGQALLTGLALAAILVLRSRQSLDFIYFQF